MAKRLVMIELDVSDELALKARKCSNCRKWQPAQPEEDFATCTNFGPDHTLGREFFCRAWEGKES
jgi:hypothetical protein